MKIALKFVLAACACTLFAQQNQRPAGPVDTDKFRTRYIRLGPGGDEALLYEPLTSGPNSRIALIYAHPDGNTFNFLPAPELAKRGYRFMTVNHHGAVDVELFAQPLSRGIAYLRTLPGVQKVVIVGHSGGGHLVAWYDNVAEHGAAVCQGPEKLYPCDGSRLNGLAKPDGIILLDSTLGAFHEMSALDPAVEGDKRNPALDMFIAANGYDTAAKSGKYSPEFAKRFYAAQAARNAAVVDNALARLNALKQGKGQFSDDEPLVVRGMGVNAAGARLYQPDPSFVSHTKKPHTLLKADGTRPEVIVNSVRPPTGQQVVGQLNSLSVMTENTTVREFLAHFAIRTKPDFAITDDDITGVDWASATTSTPANAEGITVPALVMPNSCHYLIIPDEIVFDHLASKDKTMAVVEGAVHTFTPCKPEYGDTVKRAFDYVDGWLSKPGRF
jgi:pimeloyl-ACP methyl ester carboxylesterase